MPAQKHAELEICNFNAKTYTIRPTKNQGLLISDQIRLKQACVDKIHAWIEICEFGTRTNLYTI